MPAIDEIMYNLGCTKGSGPNFYFPSTHPHLHVGFKNSTKVVQNALGCRPEIDFIALSWGGKARGIQLYTNGKKSLDGKNEFEMALNSKIGISDAKGMQHILNSITGDGFDLGF